MSALPLRPALADVLAVLTDTQPLQWAPESYRVTSVTSRWIGRRHPPQGMGVDGGVPLAITEPAEAFESLIARGVLHDAWVGDVRRFFRCVCDGKPIATPARGGQAIPSCGGCGYYDEPGDPPRPDYAVPRPPTIPALVAWASLGPPAIVRAEELARATVAALRPWGAPQPDRVVWHVRRLTTQEDDGVGCAWDDPGHDGDYALESGGQSPAGALVQQARDVWETGLVIANITADAVTIVVPPIGGAT